MLYQTIGQYQIFLWMLAAGALIGAWYALTAAVRRVLCAGVWLGLCADVAFGAGAAAIFCAALYTANYGEPRFYTVAAAALGFALFAGGVYPPGKRAVRGVMTLLNTSFIKLRQQRWIKVIFR